MGHGGSPHDPSFDNEAAHRDYMLSGAPIKSTTCPSHPKTLKSETHQGLTDGIDALPRLWSDHHIAGVKVFDNEILGKHINNMKSGVVDLSKSNFRFLLSDRPACFVDLNAPDGMVSLPIGPNKLFVGVNTPDRLKRLHALPARELVHNMNRYVVGRGVASSGRMISRKPPSFKSIRRSGWSRRRSFPILENILTHQPPH
jgi:hypothetical protein